MNTGKKRNRSHFFVYISNFLVYNALVIDYAGMDKDVDQAVFAQRYLTCVQN